MFFKIQFLFIVIFVFFMIETNGKPTAGENQKKIRCFNPSKPNDMPKDVYDKYKISSKNLTEKDKKDLWQKFVNWWKNVFAQIGQFFERVGQFFKRIFSPKNKGQPQSERPTTIAPPTPDPRIVKKGKDLLICVEVDDTTDTKSEETTVVTTTEQLITTLMTTTERFVTQEVTNQESNEIPDSTPYDPNGEHKERVTVGIIFDQKAKSNANTDPTVVKGM